MTKDAWEALNNGEKINITIKSKIMEWISIKDRTKLPEPPNE